MPYWMALTKLVDLKKHIKVLLEKQLIRSNVSPWETQMLLVKKKDISFRLCGLQEIKQTKHKKYVFPTKNK